MFDRFDICEAYLLFENDWSMGGICERAKARYYKRMALAEDKGQDDLRIPRLESTGVQLHRMQFKNRRFLSYETLSENGRHIYWHLVATYEPQGLSYLPEIEEES